MVNGHDVTSPRRVSVDRVRLDPQLQRHVRGLIGTRGRHQHQRQPASVSPAQPRHLPAGHPRLQPDPLDVIHSANSSCRRPHAPSPGKTRNMSTHTGRSTENRVRCSIDSGQPLKSGVVTAAPGLHRDQRACCAHPSRAEDTDRRAGGSTAWIHSPGRSACGEIARSGTVPLQPALSWGRVRLRSPGSERAWARPIRARSDITARPDPGANPSPSAYRTRTHVREEWGA